REKMRENKEARMSGSAPMYMYATEMVSLYYRKLNIKNKSLLTICGSGDQVINAVFFGAKKVVGFDLNKRSEFITRLKIAFIKTLSYKKFMEFFNEGINEKSFNYNIYKNISKKLDRKTNSFFDQMYKKYDYDGKKLSSSKLFRKRKDIIGNKIKNMNIYLKNNKNYLKTRNMLKKTKFKFIRKDIKNISEIELSGLDLVNLSNAPNYFLADLRRKGTKKMIEYFHNNILLEVKNKMKKGGKIFYYIYSDEIYPNKIAKSNSILSKKRTLKKIEGFGEFSIKEIYFRGTDKRGKDRIVVLESK
ncbi:MAG: DUF3419 family protein, partial [Candidatus Pacearchaeota archaeon]